MNAFLTGLEQAREDGPDLSAHPLGRVVLRLARRHRDRRAPRRHRHRRGEGAARQGRRRERPARLPGLRGGLLDPALADPRRRRAPTRSARCGPRPASRTRPTPTRCTSPSSSRPAPSTRCRRRPSTPTADHGEITGDTVTPFYAEAAEVLDSLERLGISYADVTAQARARGRRQVREVLGRAARRASRRELEKATA